MQSNTTIVCSQQISTGEFMVIVDEKGCVHRSKLIGELKYNNSRIFNRVTSVGNFTAQLAMLLPVPSKDGFDVGIMHNHNTSHCFSQFIGEYLINKTLSDSSIPSPNFEDAQPSLSKFYQRCFTIVLSLNRDAIFVPAGEVPRCEVCQLASLQPRMSMDPVMFYIAVGILGFQLIARTIILVTPKGFLQRFPYTLSSEIGFFHASSALSDVARTANMNSAVRNRLLKRLGGT